MRYNLNMDRPETTLFLLTSVDGKISTGSTGNLDFDKDLPGIAGVGEGLHQYYDLEKTTDEYSLNSGRVLAKVGVNEGKAPPDNVPVHFVIIDNQPHLTKAGVQHLLEKSRGLIIVTTNKDHPAHEISDLDKLKTLTYENEVDFQDMFNKLKEMGVEKITIQTGGTLNATFVREGFVDHISIVVAPLLVGGSGTPSIMDGKSLKEVSELSKIKTLQLKSVEKLEDSYLHLFYDVVNT